MEELVCRYSNKPFYECKCVAHYYSYEVSQAVHNAPIKTQHADEGMSYYICTACNKACNPKTEQCTCQYEEGHSRAFHLFVDEPPPDRKESKSTPLKYKDLSEFFHDTPEEERKEALLDVIDKANKDQKALVERVKLKEALDLANKEIKEWEEFRDLVKSKLEKKCACTMKTHDMTMHEQSCVKNNPPTS